MLALSKSWYNTQDAMPLARPPILEYQSEPLTPPDSEVHNNEWVGIVTVLIMIAFDLLIWLFMALL